MDIVLELPCEVHWLKTNALIGVWGGGGGENVMWSRYDFR